MNYPKPIMSISELVELGYSREMLYRAAHALGSKRYILRTPGNGKILFDTEKFDRVKDRLWKDEKEKDGNVCGRESDCEHDHGVCRDSLCNRSPVPDGETSSED